MSQDAFVQALHDPAGDLIPGSAYAALFSLADTSHTGSLTQAEWSAFHHSMKRPDADLALAFRLIGASDTLIDSIPAQEILNQLNMGGLELNLSQQSGALGVLAAPTSFRRYRREVRLGYGEFSQLSQAIKTERIAQTFNSFDRKASGYISRADFAVYLALPNI